MSSVSIEPLKLAVRYDPPLLALVYTKGGPRRFLHEFPLNDDDLIAQPEDVLSALVNSHPGYLENVNRDQVMRLITMVQDQYEQDPEFNDGQGMEEFLSDMRSKMTEEQYNEFIAKMEAGEIVMGNEDFEDEDDDPLNQQRPGNHQMRGGRHIGALSDEETQEQELSEEDFGF